MCVNTMAQPNNGVLGHNFFSHVRRGKCLPFQPVKVEYGKYFVVVITRLCCSYLQYLSQCIVGASLEEMEEEEEDNESVASGGIATPKEGCYEVIGTLKDKSQPKPEFVKEIIDVSYIYMGLQHLMTLSRMACYNNKY